MPPPPLIDSVVEYDSPRARLTAERSFRPETDWCIGDHMPFKQFDRPILPGVVAAETFLQAASLLFPYLSCTGLQSIRFDRFLFCEKNKKTPVRIACERVEKKRGGYVCRVSILSKGDGPGPARWESVCRGEVAMSAAKKAGYPASPEAGGEGRKPLEGDAIVSMASVRDGEKEWTMEPLYDQRTCFGPRFRILKSIFTGRFGKSRGTARLSGLPDFEDSRNVRRFFPFYLLESLFQVCVFHSLLADDEKTTFMVPEAVESVSWGRPCHAGETLFLFAELKNRKGKSRTWDATGQDADGNTLMRAKGIRLAEYCFEPGIEAAARKGE